MKRYDKNDRPHTGGSLRLSGGATMGKGCRPFLLNPAACTLLRLWGESEDLWEDGEEMAVEVRGKPSTFLKAREGFRACIQYVRTKDTAPPGVSLKSASRELCGDQQT